MILALSLVALAVALVLVWRGHDVRLVLFAVALVIGFAAGQGGAVFRKTAETLADPKFLLPICSAMGFAHVCRDTGCVEALVRLLLRPIARAPRLGIPAGSAVAVVVNAAIPSQTSTLAAVGPLVVALNAKVGANALEVGAALVFGSSVAGALLNPGVAEVGAVAQMTGRPALEVVAALAPSVVVAFMSGLALLLGVARFTRAAPEALPSVDVEGERPAAAPPAYLALIPPIPIACLVLAHPSLPTHRLLAPVMPAGLEVFTVMIASSLLALAAASRDRARTTRVLFEGMGWAFANIVVVIAVSTGIAKALEAAGLMHAFVATTSGHPGAALAAAFFLAFGLGAISGSGTAPSVALVGVLGPHTAELGVGPMTLGGVILCGAEAGRTTSPVSAVLNFGCTLCGVPPRVLVARLALPCLVAGAAGAMVCVLR